MFGSPFYSSYYDPSDYYSSPYGRSLDQQRALMQQQQKRAQRSRRAQYLPDEEEFSDEDADYQLSPRDRLYLEARKRQEAMEMERRRKEEELIAQKRLEAQRQEEARRQAYRQHYQPPQQQRTARSLAKPSKSPQSKHIPIRSRSPSPQASELQPAPALAVATHPIPPEVLERQNEAATRIQTSYRIHRSFSTLKELEREFEDLKASFTPPTTIDFEGPNGIVSVTPTQPLPSTFDAENTPKLAFNSTNYPLHAYVESLNRILIKLDGVQSWGEVAVRKERRRIVGRVEAEASEVDTYWKQVWASHVVQSSDSGKST